MQEAVHSRPTQNVSQLIKLDCKRVEPDAYRQKIDSFYCSKNDITKFLWGDLGASPPQLFGRGGDRPHRPHGVGAYGADLS